MHRNSDCNNIIVKTVAFMYDLSTISDQTETFKTPLIAMPRLPHDVIFAIGGWSCGQARAYVEVYDTRADRWITLPNEDPQGVRAYHGCVVVDHKIYCVGGYNGIEYFNLCTVFDAVKKTWKEVNGKRCWDNAHLCMVHRTSSIMCCDHNFRSLQCTVDVATSALSK